MLALIPKRVDRRRLGRPNALTQSICCKFQRMSDPVDALTALRQKIDSLDSKLLDLLNQRAGLAKEVARVKTESGTAPATFYRPERERALIDHLQEKNSGPFPGEAIRPVFQEIISACLSLEEGMDVAYLGPETAFTHQAVKRHFGTSAKAIPCGTIAAVFAEVERGVASFGVVPVENSSDGIVSHTLDCFVESALIVEAEVVVDVQHFLLTRDGQGENDIERVYAHPQALSMCRKWLRQNLPHAQVIECASSADAARRAKSESAGACVAGELTARMYGLCVWRRNLQSKASELTRFLVIGREKQSLVAAEKPAHAAMKTSLLLTLPDRAGALREVLAYFENAGINLCKIESRPTKEKAWDYVFFLDLDGHQDDEKVSEALTRLAGSCELFKVLGSYPKADIHE